MSGEIPTPVEEYIRLKVRSSALAYERELHRVQAEAIAYRALLTGYRQAIHEMQERARRRHDSEADRAVRESNKLYGDGGET